MKDTKALKGVAAFHLEIEIMEVARNTVTEGQNFVWIPTGHIFGVPNGIVGYWEGDMRDEHNAFVDFPEGRCSVTASAMLKPTESEIDAMLADNTRWAERFNDTDK